MIQPLLILVFVYLTTTSLAQQDFYTEYRAGPRLTALGQSVFAAVFSLQAGFFSHQYMLGAAVDCRHVLFEYAYHSSSFSNAFYSSPYQHMVSASFHL